VLLGEQPLRVRLPGLVPFTGLTFSLDALGAWFVVIIGAVAVASAVFGAGYARHVSSSRTFHALLPIFVLSMFGVASAGSVTTFLLTWELMALTSLAMVLTEHARRDAVRDAATWYAVMTHLGLACLLVALVMLAVHAGGDTFDAVRAAAASLDPTARTVVMLLIIVGFGSKAGLVPVHVWLPRAHPEAPSHVSALLSGAMVKLGIYGLLRFGFDLAGPQPRWWGFLLLALGIGSSLFGVLHAMVASDLKRLLAYSTSENAGIIVMGLGAASVLADHPALSALVLAAALLHCANHAAFKGLLFLSSGAVLDRTGTRDLDRLGGLASRMPVTTAFFAVGAMSIAALPPLNGFVSEWLLLQGLVAGGRSGSTAAAIAMPLAVAALALTTGLVAATFLKAFGTGFLAQPRSAGAADARDASPTMLAGMGVLGAACVALGLGTPLLRAPLALVLGPLDSTGGVPLRVSSLGLVGSGAVVAPVQVAAAVAATVLALAIVRRVVGGRRKKVEAWGCGRTHQTARMEYTATSFAEPLQRVFDDVLRPDLDLDVTPKAESAYFLESIRFHSGISDGIEQRVYRPVIAAFRAWGRLARGIQSGSVHRYLVYAFAALLIVLVVAR
jgi:formate hydrogenlyase subunit 3/multisubunit Na+/H+ antiporter MnhD subunit